jgi:hypothetical protein
MARNWDEEILRSTDAIVNSFLSLTVANYRLLITFVNTMLLATHYICLSVIMYVCRHMYVYMFIRSVRTCVCTVCICLYSSVCLYVCVDIFVCK